MNESKASKDKESSCPDFQRIDEHGDVSRQIFKHSVIPIIIHDMGMKILDANDSALKQFGYTKSGMLKKSIYDLHAPEQFSHSNRVLEEMKSKKILSVETEFVKKDGSTFWAQIAPCKFVVDGKPLVHVFIQDITENKKSEEKLKETNRKLQSKNKELEQFAHIVGHDLKTPLSTSIGLIDLLEHEINSLKIETPNNKNLTDLLQRLHKNINYMGELVSDTHTYSTLENKSEVAKIVDLNEIVEDIIPSYRELVKGGLAEVSAVDLPKIKSNPCLMRQLFQNLIDNSVKFRRENVPLRIYINSKPKENGWEINFEDNGMGVSPGARDKIFKLFQRAEEAQSYPGTGLGLSICKKIVELYNGNIKIDKSYKKAFGTKFIIYLESLD